MTCAKKLRFEGFSSVFPVFFPEKDGKKASFRSAPCAIGKKVGCVEWAFMMRTIRFLVAALLLGMMASSVANATYGYGNPCKKTDECKPPYGCVRGACG